MTPPLCDSPQRDVIFYEGPLSGTYIKLRYSLFHYIVTPPLCDSPQRDVIFYEVPLSGTYFKLRSRLFHYVVTPPLCLLIDWC